MADILRGTFSLVVALAALSFGGSTNVQAARATVSNVSVHQDTSVNWAGYVAQDNTSYTQVGATWSVPAPVVQSGAGIASDAAWVGIGGVESTDLIQAGTQALIQNGRIVYRAWYETLPDTQTPIPLAVRGGDSVSVSLMQVSKNLWHLSFINNTTGKSYAKDIAYKSSLSSAEWIQERPLIISGRAGSFSALDEFGTITFTNAFTMAGGKRLTISEAGAQSVVMQSAGRQVLAAPSALATSSSFTVTRAAGASDNTLASPRYGARSYTGRKGVTIILPTGEQVRVRLLLGR